MLTTIEIVVGALGTVSKFLERERIGNQRKNLNYLDYSIVEFSQNTERSPEDFRR